MAKTLPNTYPTDPASESYRLWEYTPDLWLGWEVIPHFGMPLAAPGYSSVGPQALAASVVSVPLVLAFDSQLHSPLASIAAAPQALPTTVPSAVARRPEPYFPAPDSGPVVASATGIVGSEHEGPEVAPDGLPQVLVEPPVSEQPAAPILTLGEADILLPSIPAICRTVPPSLIDGAASGGDEVTVSGAGPKICPVIPEGWDFGNPGSGVTLEGGWYGPVYPIDLGLPFDHGMECSLPADCMGPAYFPQVVQDQPVLIHPIAPVDAVIG